MLHITIDYKPIKCIPFFKSVTSLSPDRWSDISGKQLDAFEQLAGNQIDGVKFLSIMLSVPERLVKRFTDFEKYNFFVLLEFLRDTEGYLKQCARLGRTASIEQEQLYTPLHYIVEQKKQAEK